jgi:hypothetical protein
VSFFILNIIVSYEIYFSWYLYSYSSFHLYKFFLCGRSFSIFFIFDFKHKIRFVVDSICFGLDIFIQHENCYLKIFLFESFIFNMIIDMVKLKSTIY